MSGSDAGGLSVIEQVTASFVARGDLAHLALLLWALGASLLLAATLRELAGANRRFDDFVRELARFNTRHDDASS
ncbi:hypothetical protein ACUSIJ_03415 [Pseudochelatococcus sp. B33]